MAPNNVILGVGGGIAAYKSAELARTLVQREVRVQVVMTAGAQEFVRPLTFATLTGRKVITSMFSSGSAEDTLSSAVEHIGVAQDNELLVVAPTPVVALNRAVAIGEVEGPAAALALVDELVLDNYHPFHATRADLLARLGRGSEAKDAYQRAAALAPTEAERDFLSRGGRGSRPAHR